MNDHKQNTTKSKRDITIKYSKLTSRSLLSQVINGINTMSNSINFLPLTPSLTPPASHHFHNFLIVAHSYLVT